MPNERPLDQQRWLECENVGSQAIPSWGVVEITGVVNTDGQRMVLQVRRPTADNRTTVAVNFISPIAVSGFGKCTLSMPTFAVYDTSNSPVNGEEWGTQANLFTLKKDNTGFLIHGGLLGSGATSRVEVQRAFGAASDDAKIGKVNDASGIPAISGDTMTGATVDIYTATGGSLVITAPLETITAYNASDTAIDDGDVVLCHNESETNVWITTAIGSSADDAKIGKTNTIVAAKSGSTMGGSADNVDIYTMTGGVVAITSGPLETLTGYNPNEEAIPSGTFVLCTRETASSEWVLEYLEAGFTYAAAGIGGTGSERVQPTDTLTVLGESTDLGFDVHDIARVSTVVFDTVHMAFTTCTGLVTADFTASDTSLTGSFPVDGVTTMMGKLVVDADMTTGTVLNSIGASGSNNDRVFLSYDHTASLAAAADRWEITTPPGGSWNVNADNSSVQVISHGDELLIKGGTGIDTATSFGAVATVTITITDPIYTISPTSGTSVPVSHGETVIFTAAPGSGLTITGNGTNTITFDSSGGGDWTAQGDTGSELVDNTITAVDFEGGSAKAASAVSLLKTTVSQAAGVVTVDIEGDISIATKRILTAAASATYEGAVSGDTTVEVEDGTDNAEEWEAGYGIGFDTPAGLGVTNIESHSLWGIAQSNSGDGSSILIKLCSDETGAGATLGTFTCHVRTGMEGNNIRQNEVIPVTRTQNGDFATAAGASPMIGAMMQWVLSHGAGAGHPMGGWAIMDGTLNAGGSGLDLRSKFIKGRPSGSGAINGTTHTGGTTTHTHDDHADHAHQAATGANVGTTGTDHAIAACTSGVMALACGATDTLTHSTEDNDPEFQGIYYIERVS